MYNKQKYIMSQAFRTTKRAGNLEVRNTATLNNIRLTRTSVSQGTAITSGVTIDSPAGFIFTLTTGTLATGGSASFAVSNTAVSADSLILANIVNHGGNGIPLIRVNNVTEGSFNLSVRNIDLVNPMTGSLRVGFSVL